MYIGLTLEQIMLFEANVAGLKDSALMLVSADRSQLGQSPERDVVVWIGRAPRSDYKQLPTDANFFQIPEQFVQACKFLEAALNRA